MRIVVKKMELGSGKWDIVGSSEHSSLTALAHVAKSFGDKGAKIAKCFEAGAITGREMLYELEVHLSSALPENALVRIDIED